jgi:RND family efflux transporter MFP subunit
VGSIPGTDKVGGERIFGDRDRDALEELASAAALRSAQLHHRVRLVGALGAPAGKKRAVMSISRRRREVYAGVAVAVLAAVTLIRWPLRVPAWQPRLRASNFTEARNLVPGVVERVYVHEGDHVERGDTLVQLRDAELRARRNAEAADMAMAQRAAALAASQGDVAAQQLQRTRGVSLQQQIAVLDAEIASMTVRAPVSGVVLTPRPEQEVGRRIDAGTSVIALGRTDTLTLDFGVAQRDISRILTGQRVRLRVDALPERTFEGRVTFLGELRLDSAAGVQFPVRAAVPNPGDLLKPGMTPYARVLTAPTSLAGRALRAPARWLRLVWWRLWP